MACHSMQAKFRFRHAKLWNTAMLTNAFVFSRLCFLFKLKLVTRDDTLKSPEFIDSNLVIIPDNVFLKRQNKDRFWPYDFSVQSYEPVFQLKNSK